MKTRYSKLYMSDLDSKIKYECGEQFLKGFKETYYYKKLSTAIFNSSGLYVADRTPRKKGVFIVRVTFPLFVVSVWTLGGLKWLITGVGFTRNSHPKTIKFFELWNDKGGFNIL